MNAKGALLGLSALAGAALRLLRRGRARGGGDCGGAGALGRGLALALALVLGLGLVGEVVVRQVRGHLVGSIGWLGGGCDAPCTRPPNSASRR